MKHLLFPLIIILLLSCSKDKASAYPDCFENLESSHTVLASYASITYVELSDSSAILFSLNDEELEIGTSCKQLSPSDLTNWNTVRYLEWTLHPDSIPPDFGSDVLYVNSSSVRYWELSSGSINVTVSKCAGQREPYEQYSRSIQLTNGIFGRSISGLENINLDEVIIRDANAGGYGPG